MLYTERHVVWGETIEGRGHTQRHGFRTVNWTGARWQAEGRHKACDSTAHLYGRREKPLGTQTLYASFSSSLGVGYRSGRGHEKRAPHERQRGNRLDSIRRPQALRRLGECLKASFKACCAYIAVTPCCSHYCPMNRRQSAFVPVGQNDDRNGKAARIEDVAYGDRSREPV